MANELGKDVHFDIDFVTQNIDSRPDLLSKVIFELVSNAIVFADEEQPRVSLKVRVADDVCMLVVSDNGKCISNEDLPYIFDPFFTTRPEAVGMGLSIVNRIASGYNWDIDVSCSTKGGLFLHCESPCDIQVRSVYGRWF